MKQCYPFLIAFLLIGPMLQAQTENVGIGTDNPTGKLTIADTSKAALTIRTTDNSFPAGIAFQNSGLAYTWSIYRNNIGSNEANLIFANGLASDLNTLSPFLTLKSSNEVEIRGGLNILKLGGGGGLRPVFADAAGNLVLDQDTESSESIVNAGILDGGCNSGNGVVDVINISGQALVSPSNISVTVNLSHGWMADVDIFIASPTGDTLCLISDRGLGGDNLNNTVFSDSGAPLSSGSPPYAGTFQPEGSMETECTITPTIGSFLALGSGVIDPNGDWTLMVYDDDQVVDAGMLNNWSVNLDLPKEGQDGYVPNWSEGVLATTSSIFDNGNVGIGTTAPPGKLSILESQKNALTIKTPDNLLPTGIAFQNSGGAYTWTISREDAGSNNAHLVFSGGLDSDLDNLNPSLVLGSNGNIGIRTAIGGGVITPQADLHVFQTSGSQPAFKITYPSVGLWDFDIVAFNSPFDLRLRNATGLEVYLDGFTGQWGAPSDLRYKTDITRMQDILDDVCTLEARTYRFKTQEDDDQLSIGFIAQEVEKIFPEAVGYNSEKDRYSLNYDVFGVLAIQAIREQQEIINSQENRIKKLEEQMAALLGLQKTVEHQKGE